MSTQNEWDVIIIGGGASGLMCAIEAGKRGRKVLLLDHADQPGRKLLISGGGKCNFTNLNLDADNYISHNPHFVKSALNQYSQWDFIDFIQTHKIPYHEREHGQLFCDHTVKDILNALLYESQKANVKIHLKSKIVQTKQKGNHQFEITTEKDIFSCHSLVIATGGLSYSTIGASCFGHDIAKQFDIPIIPTHPGLVPLALQPADLKRTSCLSGISVNAQVSYDDHLFQDALLFTHRGLSGPAILQISSYWQPKKPIVINLSPETNVIEFLINQQKETPNRTLKPVLSNLLPKRLITMLIDTNLAEQSIGNISHEQFRNIGESLQSWTIKPAGTEGYKTAEVTVGGVDCNYISSKTMESTSTPGLYFTGEVLDVTGWLGGYNLQWAWSSGWCAGQHVC